MRWFVALCALSLAACGSPPAPAASSPATTATTGFAAASAEAPSLDAHALAGQWSFDRSCGVYDIVLGADGAASYYDYADESHVVSYGGRWAVDHNRVAFTVRRLGDDGVPTGDAATYNLDVSGAVGDDLNGQFGPAGGETRAINAKRCPDEDRN